MFEINKSKMVEKQARHNSEIQILKQRMDEAVADLKSMSDDLNKQIFVFAHEHSKNYKRLAAYKKMEAQRTDINNKIAEIQAPYYQKIGELRAKISESWCVMSDEFLSIMNTIRVNYLNKVEVTDGESHICRCIANKLEDGAEILEMESWWENENESVLEALKKYNINRFAFVGRCTDDVRCVFVLLNAGYKAEPYERTQKIFSFNDNEYGIVRGILFTKQ